MSKTCDPVCGMAVQPEKAALHAAHAGRTYYFCCDACLRRFQAKPDHYVKEAEQARGVETHS